MRVHLSWILCIVLLVLGAHGVHGVEAKVRWDGGLEGLAREVERGLPGVKADVARRLGWRYEGPAPEIVIVRNHARMEAEAGASIPTWAVGVAISGRSLIVIRADLLSAGYGSGLLSVLRHEWVHLTWGWRAGERRRQLPLWAEEGLAEEIGGGMSVDAGAALDVAAAFGRLLSFEDLRQRFPREPHGADLAYKQSRSWVRHVTHEKGWAVWREVLGDIASGVAERERRGRDPFSETVRRRTGLTLGEWHAGWRQALEQEARPWFHLLYRDLSWLLLMALAVVAAAAFYFVLRRRRRQIERLPDEGGPTLGSGAGEEDGLV